MTDASQYINLSCKLRRQCLDTFLDVGLRQLLQSPSCVLVVTFFVTLLHEPLWRHRLGFTDVLEIHNFTRQLMSSSYINCHVDLTMRPGAERSISDVVGGPEKLPFCE